MKPDFSTFTFLQNLCIHPAGRTLTSDWNISNFIMVVCEKLLQSSFGQNILTELIVYEKFLSKFI